MSQNGHDERANVFCVRRGISAERGVRLRRENERLRSAGTCAESDVFCRRANPPRRASGRVFRAKLTASETAFVGDRHARDERLETRADRSSRARAGRASFRNPRSSFASRFDALRFRTDNRSESRARSDRAALPEVDTYLLVRSGYASRKLETDRAACAFRCPR